MLFLLRLAARLPCRCYTLSARRWAGWFISVHRVTAGTSSANLALAGLSDFRRAAVAEAGKSVTEVPAVWLRPFARVADLVVEVKGWEHVAEGARRGRASSS